MRIADSPNCTVCNEVDDLPHFLVNCNYVKEFWTSLFTWLNDILALNLQVDEKSILFGLDGGNDKLAVTNYVTLQAKFFIYKLRIKDSHTLNLTSFKSQLKHKLTIEKLITEHDNPHQFVKFQLLFDCLSESHSP